MVSSAYLRLLTFLPAILIPASESSSLAFHTMYYTYKLDKQSDNKQPCCTLFPILNQSIVLCSVLIFASDPAYWFLRKQVRWSGISISYRIFTAAAGCPGVNLLPTWPSTGRALAHAFPALWLLKVIVQAWWAWPPWQPQQAFSIIVYYKIIEYSSLCYIMGPCWLSVLYMGVCI